MLHSFTLILVFQLIGELAVTALDVPVPGPVVGMVLLFGHLMIRGSVSADLDQVCSALLGNLSLLFVPAGVGVMVHFSLLGRDWLPLSLALVISTVLAVAVTASVMVWLNRRTGPGEAGGPER